MFYFIAYTTNFLLQSAAGVRVTQTSFAPKTHTCQRNR